MKRRLKKKLFKKAMDKLRRGVQPTAKELKVVGFTTRHFEYMFKRLIDGLVRGLTEKLNQEPIGLIASHKQEEQRRHESERGESK